MATREATDKLEESLKRKVKSFNIERHDIAVTLSEKYSCVKLRDAPVVEFFELCDSRFGDDWIWSAHWWNTQTDVYFKNPDDALVFRLLVNYKSF